MQLRHGLQVTVANGEHVQSIGQGRAMLLEVNDEVFAINCYTIPLEEFDLVVGIQWLETLCPILWDFANKMMSFWRGDHRITWHGMGAWPIAPHSFACIGDLMEELQDEFSAVFFRTDRFAT